MGLTTSLSANDARIVFDISASLRRSGSPRGIHRVERQFALWAAANLTNVVFVFFDPIRLAYCTVRLDVRPFLTGEAGLDTAGLPSVRRTPGTRHMVQPNGARRALVSWRAAIGPKLKLRRSDILVCAGVGWEHTNIEAIAELKSRIGFRMVLLCHDLMPLVIPRVFQRNARETFQTYIGHAFRVADRIIVNSRRTEADCRAYFAARDIRAPQILVTPFGYDFRVGRSNGTRELPAGLESNRFVMLVSTIAPRKGHWLLYHVWLRLLHEGIPQAARFKLVFVGRPRFADDPMLTEILSNREVADSLLVLTEVDDEQLAALYAGAAFCAYPSLYEGYGLPIVEAFAYGKPVLASTAGAVPEIVQDLSPCLDATDGEAWYRAMKSWIENPALRTPFAEAIRTRSRHPTWSEASAEFFRCVAAAPPGGGPPWQQSETQQTINLANIHGLECSARRDEGMMPIGRETTLARHSDVLYAPQNDEQAVLLSIGGGRSRTINETGCRIWRLLVAPMTVAQICARLCDEFEIDGPSCEAAVLRFAGEMIDDRMIYEVQITSVAPTAAAP